MIKQINALVHFACLLNVRYNLIIFSSVMHINISSHYTATIYDSMQEKSIYFIMDILYLFCQTIVNSCKLG